MTLSHIVTADEAGQRIDVCIADQTADASRTRIQKAIDDGIVLLNGHPAKKRDLVKEGDALSIPDDAFAPAINPFSTSSEVCTPVVIAKSANNRPYRIATQRNGRRSSFELLSTSRGVTSSASRSRSG